MRKMSEKSGQKLNPLSRKSTFLNKNPKRIIFNAIILAISYCPLIWMFSSPQPNNLLNRVHGRSIRLITNDQNSSFESLLQDDNDISVNQKNLQALMTEVCKIIKRGSPSLDENLFFFGGGGEGNIHNISNFQIIANGNKNTVRDGLETLCYRTP